MEQSRVEPYVGTSSSWREGSSDVNAATGLSTDPNAPLDGNDRWCARGTEDDQFTATLGQDAERTFDIPMDETSNSDDADSHDVGLSLEDSEDEVTVGATLRQRYVLHRLIGTGGTCRVFLAEDLHRRLSHETSGELIALKVLRARLRHSAHSLQRLRREFLQMQQLTHPAITRVFDLDCDADLWFLTMELVDAPSALTWMSGEYSNADALRLILACCEAVAYAHRKGIIHGDLKPGNVLVTAEGSVKIIDFGSVAGNGEAASPHARLEATPQYASPAVLAGRKAEVRDDVFSLGCLAYMILARGQHPFERKPSSEAASAHLRAPYIPGIHLRLFEVIARALAWDAAQRHGSVRELQHALLASELTRTRQSAQAAAQIDTARDRAARAARPTAEGTTETARDEPAKTPGDYSYLNKFRGYVAGPMMDGKARPDNRHDGRQNLHAQAHPNEVERLPGPEHALHPQAPAGVLAQPSLYIPTVRREPKVKPQQRPPSRLKPSAINALGIMLVLISAVVAALLSRPQPKRDVMARTVHESLSVLSLPTPVMEPAPLPVIRKPSVRIAYTAEKPERRRPSPASASAATVAASVSFDSRAVAVSPTQKLVAIPLRRSNTNNGAARVAWQIEGGRGQQLLDADRTGDQVIRFHAGQEQRTLYVPLRKPAGELAADGVRTFRVKLRQVDGGPSPGQVAEIRVTLLD